MRAFTWHRRYLRASLPAAYGPALHDTVTGREELRDAVKRQPPAAVQA